MAWYRAGAVTVTSGSPNVVGTGGTLWLSYVKKGDRIDLPDGRGYEVLAVVDDTHITLASNYAGSTASGQAYQISPTSSFSVELAGAVSQLYGDFSGYTSTSLVGRFTDGTASAPGLSFSADTDTGFYRPGANTIAISLGGGDVGRFDANGLLLGYTSSFTADATTSVVPKVAVSGTTGSGTTIAAARYSADTANASLYFAKARGTQAAPAVVQSGDNVGGIGFTAHDGSVGFRQLAAITAAVDGTPGAGDMPGRLAFSTTADGAATWTERMRIDNAGNVGVGATAPGQLVHAKRDQNAFTGVRVENASAGAAAYAGFTCHDGTTNKAMLLHFGAGYTTAGQFVQDGTALNGAGAGGVSIAAANASGSVRFYSGAATPTERMRITSTGLVGIGETAPDVLLRIKGNNVANKGQFLIDSPDFAQVSFYNGTTRKAALYSDTSGATTGDLILANYVSGGGNLIFGTNNGVERARIDSNGLLLVGQASATGDAKIQVSNGIRIGTGALSSDVNTLDYYEEGTFTPAISGSSTAGTGTYATTPTGRYTRVGNLVRFTCQASWTAHTGAGNLRIAGLPWAAAAASPALSHTINVASHNLTFTGQLTGWINSGNSFIELGVQVSATALQALPLDTAAQVFITGTYEV
jgi:hypothetical protein